MNQDEVNPSQPPSPEALNQQASIWMKRGLALLEASTPVSLLEAIGCFDQAIQLRQQLPLATTAKFRYGLAACWMNRADALTRLKTVKNLAEAVRNYDESLALLHSLPLEEDPLYRRRLAIAWQNRGLTLHTQGAPAALVEAERAFAEAITVLQHERAVDILDWKPVLATVWMNRANTLILQKTEAAAIAARLAAKQALALTIPIETKDLSAAKTGFRARYILCQAVAQMLADKNFAEFASDELVAEVTDTVDDGLTLVQEWERQGMAGFRRGAADLFRFGTRVYQTYQPHFLNEFLLENIDPERSSAAFVGSPEMHAAAIESLWRAFRGIQQQGFKTLSTPEFDDFLEQLRTLRVAEERLTGLRQQFLNKSVQKE
ncbi:MAG TPA: hypothetical protein VGO57_08950 [Verrucomicrobiae bacterium]|jgi:tetratricopeptide (TPR) repeat protein